MKKPYVAVNERLNSAHLQRIIARIFNNNVVKAWKLQNSTKRIKKITEQSCGKLYPLAQFSEICTGSKVFLHNVTAALGKNKWQQTRKLTQRRHFMDIPNKHHLPLLLAKNTLHRSTFILNLDITFSTLAIQEQQSG